MTNQTMALLLLVNTGCGGSTTARAPTEGLQAVGAAVQVGPLVVRVDGVGHAQRTSKGLTSFQAKVGEELQFVDVSVTNGHEEAVQLISRWTLVDSNGRIYKPKGDCMRALNDALVTLEPLAEGASRRGKLCFLVADATADIRMDVQGSPDEEPVRFRLK